MELDFEDFIEEVKFQMTEFEILEEKHILTWEKRVREWIENHKQIPVLKYHSKDDIIIRIKSEDSMEEMAKKYYQAVKQKKEEEYWKGFCLR